MHEDRAPESVWTGQSTKRRWRRRPAAAKLLWSSGREKGNPGAPLGTWAVDGTLALARFDKVRAYGLTTGEPLWTWQPPGEGDQVIAHVSQDAADGVAVVLHHDDRAGQDGVSDAWHVHLTGLDLRTGTAVWTRAQRADELGSVSVGAGEVALGGGRVATALTRDGDTKTTVRVLDARTGALQWERPLPEGWGDASVLAAEPVVVSTVGPEDPVPPLAPRRLFASSAPRRLYVVSAHAEQAIDLPQPHKGPSLFDVLPLQEAFGGHPVVFGDALAVELVSPQPEDQEHTGSSLRAFSTATGDFRWSWSSTRGRTIFPLAHRGYLLVLNGYGDRATVLDPADGRVVAERSLPGYSFQARLVAFGDCIGVVCTAPRTPRRVRVFRWK